MLILCVKTRFLLACLFEWIGKYFEHFIVEEEGWNHWLLEGDNFLDSPWLPIVYFRGSLFICRFHFSKNKRKLNESRVSETTCLKYVYDANRFLKDNYFRVIK